VPIASQARAIRARTRRGESMSFMA
jgi:hypothetical protein